MLPKKYNYSNKKILMSYIRNNLVICKTALMYFLLKEEFKYVIGKKNNFEGIIDIMGGISPSLDSAPSKKKISYETSNNFRKATKFLNPKVKYINKFPEVKNFLIFINYDYFNLKRNQQNYDTLKKLAFKNKVYAYRYNHEVTNLSVYFKRNRGIYNSFNVYKNLNNFTNFMHMGKKKIKTKNIQFLKLTPSY